MLENAHSAADTAVENQGVLNQPPTCERKISSHLNFRAIKRLGQTTRDSKSLRCRLYRKTIFFLLLFRYFLPSRTASDQSAATAYYIRSAAAAALLNFHSENSRLNSITLHCLRKATPWSLVCVNIKRPKKR